MVRLEAVNGKNVWELLKLSVEDSQREFVASNEISKRHIRQLLLMDMLILLEYMKVMFRWDS